MTSVLLIEDEPNLRNSLCFILANAGYEACGVETGEEGLAMARELHPDVVLLDIGLPGMDGFEVAARLGDEQARGARIVVLTGSDDEDDMVRAFDAFADDYVVKPVRPRVLLARLRKLLGAPEAAPQPAPRAMCLGDLRIDLDGHEVWRDGAALYLTRTEFDLLTLLAASPNRVRGRLDIIAAVHGASCVVSERSIDFQVHGLRKKLEPSRVRIETVRGVGFKLVVDAP